MSLATTVATPSKWPGRAAPSSVSEIPATLTRVVALGKYMTAAVGLKTAATPACCSHWRSRSGLVGYRSRSSLGPNWIGFTKMLTTTLEFSRQARSTRLMWPACSAPIVGTRPIVWPSRRQALAVASSAAGVSMTTGPLASAVLDLFARFLRRRGRAVRRVAVLRAGERPAANLLGVLV